MRKLGIEFSKLPRGTQLVNGRARTEIHSVSPEPACLMTTTEHFYYEPGIMIFKNVFIYSLHQSHFMRKARLVKNMYVSRGPWIINSLAGAQLKYIKYARLSKICTSSATIHVGIHYMVSLTWLFRLVWKLWGWFRLLCQKILPQTELEITFHVTSCPGPWCWCLEPNQSQV